MGAHSNNHAPSAAYNSPASVLVVEDNVALRYMLSEWLRQSGYVVAEASSADEAALLLSSPLSIDLLITDIKMNGCMDGYDLIKHVQKICRGLPVIAVSAHASWERIKELEVGDYFKKPYDLDAIVTSIEKLLGSGNERKK